MSLGPSPTLALSLYNPKLNLPGPLRQPRPLRQPGDPYANPDPYPNQDPRRPSTEQLKAQTAAAGLRRPSQASAAAAAAAAAAGRRSSESSAGATVAVGGRIEPGGGEGEGGGRDGDGGGGLGSTRARPAVAAAARRMAAGLRHRSTGSRALSVERERTAQRAPVESSRFIWRHVQPVLRNASSGGKRNHVTRSRCVAGSWNSPIFHNDTSIYETQSGIKCFGGLMHWNPFLKLWLPIFPSPHPSPSPSHSPNPHQQPHPEPRPGARPDLDRRALQRRPLRLHHEVVPAAHVRDHLRRVPVRRRGRALLVLRAARLGPRAGHALDGHHAALLLARRQHLRPQLQGRRRRQRGHAHRVGRDVLRPAERQLLAWDNDWDAIMRNASAWGSLTNVSASVSDSIKGTDSGVFFYLFLWLSLAVLANTMSCRYQETYTRRKYVLMQRLKQETAKTDDSSTACCPRPSSRRSSRTSRWPTSPSPSPNPNPNPNLNAKHHLHPHPRPHPITPQP